MSRTVLITGATGSIGGKLRRHFGQGGGYDLRLLCLNPLGDPAVVTADLSQWEDGWAGSFAGADTVIHLAGDPSPRASWDSIQRLNVDVLLNVLDAARLHRVQRVVFASSNWVMAGYRHGTERLTTELAPWPVNPYGHSKLFGERAGRSLAARHGISFIALRIGWCRREPGNQPGPQMAYGSWGQQMWLSDSDICHGMERAVLAQDVPFAVLNLMSDNPGMRWDIEQTRKVIGYQPGNWHAAVLSEEERAFEERARGDYAAIQELKRRTLGLY